MPAAQPCTRRRSGPGCRASAGSGGGPAPAAAAGCCRPAAAGRRSLAALRATMSAPDAEVVARAAEHDRPARPRPARRASMASIRPVIIASSMALRFVGRSSSRRSTGTVSCVDRRPPAIGVARRVTVGRTVGDGVERRCRSVAPPGGSGRRTGPCSRLGSRIVAWPGRGDLAPLVARPELEVDRRPVALGEVLAGSRCRAATGCRRRS